MGPASTDHAKTTSLYGRRVIVMKTQMVAKASVESRSVLTNQKNYGLGPVYSQKKVLKLELFVRASRCDPVVVIGILLRQAIGQWQTSIANEKFR